MILRGLFLTAALSSATAQASTIPAGFSELMIPIPAITNVTDIEWVPDGSQRLFVATQDGDVRIIQDGVLLPTPFLKVPVVQPRGQETGLIGMCFDPDFLRNRYLYLFVTTSSFEQRIVRYEAIGDRGTNRVDLIKGLPTRNWIHNGGGVAIGHDGKLYFALGDMGGNMSTGFATAVNRANLDGSPLPLNPFGPFGWAGGFRNPFKIAFQPETGLLWVNVAGEGYEQIFQVNRRDRAGWTYRYENNQPAPYITPKIAYATSRADVRPLLATNGVVRTNDIATFNTITNHLFRKGQKITISGVADPTFNVSNYIHSVPSPRSFTFRQTGPDAASGGGTATTLKMGNVVTGGTFYNSTAFSPEYHGNYFFCDCTSGINRAVLDGSNEVSSVDFFGGVVLAIDVTTGPDGALYYATLNPGYLTNPTNRPPGAVYKLVQTNVSQTIIVSPKNLLMAEGGLSLCNVRLAHPVSNDVTVTVTRTAGTNITSTNTTLTFTSDTYDKLRPIYFQATTDSDPFPSRAAFSLSAPNLPAQEIRITAYDPEAGRELRFASVSQSNGIARMELWADANARIDLQASANLQNWTTIISNVVAQGDSPTILEAPITLPDQRFYRARPGAEGF